MEIDMSEFPDPALSVKALRYVACVSYPRSGHGLTERVLRNYFQDQFTYCEFYKPDPQSCCKVFPCSKSGMTLSKNHDMGLKASAYSGIPKVDGVPYFVLYRNFLEAVVSEYERRLRLNHIKQDSKAEWKLVCKQMLAYYRRFVKKWIFDPDPMERLLIRYEDLTEDPILTYTKVIEFFQPCDPVDRPRLQHIVEGARALSGTAMGVEYLPETRVRNRRVIEEFKYFDRSEFASLERQLAHEFMQLGYPLRYAEISQVNSRSRFCLPGFSWFSRKRNGL